MALTDKIQTIKQLVNLICNVIPGIVDIIKQIIVAINELKTA